MSNPAFSVEGVLDALAMQPRRGAGAGRAIMLISARRKEGVTTAARAVAQSAGPGAVYAIDLDLKRNAFARELANIDTFGQKLEGRLNATSFYSIRSPSGIVLQERAPAFAYHRVGQTRIYAGIFDPRLIPEGGRVAISPMPHYWDAVRTAGAMAVVDAPALDRSEIGLRVARNMDGIVLVVGSDKGAAPAAIAAKDKLVDAGANLMGIVYAGATAPVMAIDRMLRQIA